ESPQSIDGHRLSQGVFQRTFGNAAREIERVDAAVAKITDQQAVSECAEARWSERQPPGRVEDAVCGETRLPRAVGCKHVDEAVPGTTDVIVLLVVLQSKGDVEIAFNVFNPERSVAQRDRGIGEGLCEVERRVVHLYDSIVEVGGVDESLAPARSGGEAFVNRGAGIGHGNDRVVKIDGGTPANDGAVLGRKYKQGRARLHSCGHNETGRAVEDQAGWGRGPARAGARYFHDQRRNRSWDGRAVTSVERGVSGAVVGDPDRTGRRERNAPRIDQVRIGTQRNSGNVGN